MKTRPVLTFLAAVAALIALVWFGQDYAHTHPRCDLLISDYNGKLRHGQPVTEQEKEWYRQCTE